MQDTYKNSSKALIYWASSRLYVSCALAKAHITYTLFGHFPFTFLLPKIQSAIDIQLKICYNNIIKWELPVLRKEKYYEALFR